MAKHPHNRRSIWKPLVSLISAAALSFGALVSASASDTYSVLNTALDFNKVAPFNSAVDAVRDSGTVEAATTANITLSGEQTIDGVSVVTGDLVLVKNQTTASQNGIYVVDAGAWSRSTAYDFGAEIDPGDFVNVPSGTVNANTGWIQQNNVTQVGTDAVTFARGLVQLDGDGHPDIGEDITPTTYVDYLDVVTVNGQRIDARVTYLGHYGVEISSTPGLLDKLDDGSSTSGANRYIRTDARWNTAQVSEDRYAEFKIEFFKNLATTPVAVTLQNLSLSIYDIDNQQFVSLTGFDRYYLSDTGSIITPTVQGSFLKLQASNTNLSGNDSVTLGRASLEFDSISSFTYRLGVIKEDTDTTASFELDFGPGLAWTGGARGSAVVNPVNASSAPAPYTGPIPASLSVSCVPAGQASTAVLTGERLNTITSAEVDGKAVAVSEVTATSVKLALPALTAGTYSVIYNSSSGRLTHQDSLRVCASAGAPVTVNPGQTPFTVTKRFTGYRGDRGPVVARDLRAITAFIKANPGLTSVTCTGSTSGVPAKSTDQALATARATNACNIVKRLVPGVTTSISTITGQGVGQFHRAVIITGQGTRP